MARHVVTLGANPDILTNTDIRWQPPAADRAIPTTLGSGFLRQFFFRTVNAAIFLRISQTDFGDGVQAGPDLTSAWEQSDVAITLDAPGLSYTIGGPNSSDSLIADSTEPYSWSLAASELTAIGEFIAAWNSLTDADKATTTLTLDDGADIAPSFSDDTGDAISGTVGTAITPVTVPEA